MLTGKNPIIPGFHPDPSILRVGDDYYIATSTFQWFPGVQLYHSKDLVNWEELPSPLRRVSQLDMKGNPNSGGIWGPCLSYCDGTFYLIYTNTKNFHGIFKDTPNYLVTTTDLYGEWSEPVYLNSSGFDPSLFHDDDGKKYLLNMRWDHRMERNDFSGILLQEYSEKEKRLVGEPRLIFEGTATGATEAPHIYKRNGYYYLMLAEGGTMYNHGVQLARSKSIFGPYEADPQPLLTTRNNPESPLQRTGHASLVETQTGDLYVAYLCARPIDKGCSILGRETAISQVYFDKDGWLRLKDGGVVPKEEFSVNLPECKVKAPQERFDFDIESLPPAYKTLRIPFDEKMGSLSERKGYLRLYGHDSITSWHNLSLVARRLQHHNVEVTAELEFDPCDFQQMAGLTVYYDSYNFFYFYMSHDEKYGNVLRIIVRDGMKFYNPVPTGAVYINDFKKVWLRAVIRGTKISFYCSFDDFIYVEVGPENLDCSNLCDEAYVSIGHEGHTGTFIGLTCQDLTGGQNGKTIHADFKSLTYRVLDENEE